MQNLRNKLSHYHFEIRHLIILFAALAVFQTILSYINKTSTNSMLSKTLELYKKDSAENLADLTATSLELLLEHEMSIERGAHSRRTTVREINIILSQQTLQQHVSEICILMEDKDRVFTFTDGSPLYGYFFEHQFPEQAGGDHGQIRRYFADHHEHIIEGEQIKSFMDDARTFHVLVPFVPLGEVTGALYMKISPDFSNLAYEISSVYNETGAIFSALILLSLLAVFYVSSYMLRERDLAQKQLFDERQRQMRHEIEHQKEALFTRRIYHAHHKAEKVMGFIKEDIRAINQKNAEAIKQKIIKYANFVSRVIYDMKSYDPPMSIIRNPIFRTQINDVLAFIVDNIFRRVYHKDYIPRFRLEFDKDFPVIMINEYVVWEVLEPLIQNSIDHNPDCDVEIRITTRFKPGQARAEVIIEDNGRGISDDLLQRDTEGIRRLFREHTSTKDSRENSGYGCYIAYEISTRRCGWQLDAQNRTGGGARFILTIPTDRKVRQ